jgi:D-3-phosphoglycerate dehydrogenase
LAPLTILVSESSRFSPAALLRLQSIGRVELADVADRRELLSKVRDADILWVRLRHRIDGEIMEGAPRLRAIATPTTGLNHIDLDEAQRRNIQILSLRGHTDFLRNIYATAEHTMALIFALIRRLPAAAQHVNAGSWNRDLFVGQELHDKTAGIVGYGRVGRMVAQYLSAFGMRVQITDPRAGAESLPSGVEVTSLDNLLKTSDLVTLHVDLTEKTRGFFGKREFDLMKHRSWFINTSRGELIAEAALLDALRNGRIAGAALDVLCDENSSGTQHHPLVQYSREHANLLITPHIAGCTIESTEKTENFIAEQVVAFLQAPSEEAFAQAGKREELI